MSDHDTAPRQRRGYFGLWAGMPRELVFLLIAMPIAWVGFSVAVTLVSTGFGLLVLVVGVLCFTGTFYVARGFGWTERRLLHWTGRPEIRSPWPPIPATTSFWRGAFGPFIDGHYWLHVLHLLVVAPIVSLFTFVVTVVWVSIGLGGATYWFWERWLPLDGQNVWTIEYVWEFVFGVPLTADPRQAEAVFYLVLGLVFLVTLPLILPAIIAGWMLAFTLSLDDLVISSFTSGPGATTLPMKIYSQVRLGVTPEINAVCTVLIGIVTTGVIIASIAAKRAEVERRRAERLAAQSN